MRARRTGFESSLLGLLSGGAEEGAPSAVRLKGRIGGGGGTAVSVSFETGWTMPSSRSRSRNCWSGACYPDDKPLRILVPARVARRQPVYESLQGGPEVGPLSTPRRYRCRRRILRWPAPSGFADVSPVVTSPLRVKATLLDRTRVRKHYATGHYMLSSFFDSRCTLPEEQGRRTASFRAF